jgi:hypothetical protein
MDDPGDSISLGKSSQGESSPAWRLPIEHELRPADAVKSALTNGPPWSLLKISGLALMHENLFDHLDAADPQTPEVSPVGRPQRD